METTGPAPHRLAGVTLWTGGGYGWKLDLGDRVRWSSTGAVTHMWPRLYRGADEHCNPTLGAHLWPLGGLVVWYGRRLRTERDGRCAECWEELRREGLCERCSCRPCSCADGGGAT